MDLEEFLTEWHDESPTLTVHTSGSIGRPKPMVVEKRRMEASARTTLRFLGLKAGQTALLCMPLDYIAGKMMVVRALVGGLRLVAVEPSGRPEWNGHIDFAAMVPLQVWNLLHAGSSERQRLRSVRHLIIGGGAIDEALACELHDFPNAVWSTYGMTETLSHIALRRLNGPERSQWYSPVEGVTLRLSAEGCLVVDAPAVCAGTIVTNDIAEFRADGYAASSTQFRIVGRKDNTICSGGIKIQAEEVERLLRPHLRLPFLITKRSDEKFGETVVLLTEDADVSGLQSVCRAVLPVYWRPKHIVCVDKLPTTATGKPARGEALLIAARNQAPAHL